MFTRTVKKLDQDKCSFFLSFFLDGRTTRGQSSLSAIKMTLDDYELFKGELVKICIRSRKSCGTLKLRLRCMPSKANSFVSYHIKMMLCRSRVRDHPPRYSYSGTLVRRRLAVRLLRAMGERRRAEQLQEHRAGCMFPCCRRQDRMTL